MRHTGFMSAIRGGAACAYAMARLGDVCRRIPAAIAGLALVAILMALSTGSARAQITIDPSQSVGPVPRSAGTGLDGAYYYFPDSSISDLSGAMDLVSSASGPTGVFSTTNICYPDCLGNAFDTGSGGLEAFTNGNATNFNYPIPKDQVPTTSFYQTVLDIGGYLAIPTAGTYTFSINSDDGSQVAIGGTLIDVDDGIHGQQAVANDVSFTAAGLYAIAVTYFQNGGGAGLDLTATDSNGNCFFGCPADGGAQPNALFYSNSQGAPAPVIGGGWPSLAACALLGTGALIRRRRQSRRI